jgi:Na+/phosphate symporter
MELVIKGYEQGNPDMLSKARSRAGEITHLARELRDEYLAKVTEKRSEPLVTVVYTDMLHSYRRIKDHALNVAESLAGEK